MANLNRYKSICLAAVIWWLEVALCSGCCEKNTSFLEKVYTCETVSALHMGRSSIHCSRTQVDNGCYFSSIIICTKVKWINQFVWKKCFHFIWEEYWWYANMTYTDNPLQLCMQSLPVLYHSFLWTYFRAKRVSKCCIGICRERAKAKYEEMGWRGMYASV